MHRIQLNDELYQFAQRRAAESGCNSVDEFVADWLQHEQDEEEVIQRLFTPQRLAQIDRAIAEVEAGGGLSREQAQAELARRRDEWLRQNPT